MKRQDFRELSKAKQLTDDNYPHSQTGLSLRNSIKAFIWLLIIAVALIFIINKGATHLDNKLNPKIIYLDDSFVPSETIEGDSESDVNADAPTESETGSGGSFLDGLDRPSPFGGSFGGVFDFNLENFKDKITDAFSSFISKVAKFNFENQTVQLMLKLNIIIIMVLIVLYIINVIKRSRLYERNIIKNDGNSLSYTSKIKKYIDINTRLNEAKKALDKEKPSPQDKHKIEALTKIQNAKLYINTREIGQEDLVKTQYRLIIELPTYIPEREILFNEIKNLELSATYIMDGDVKFGSAIIDNAKKTITWRASITEKDPYKIKDTTEVKESSSFKPIYPLDLLIDRSEEINQKKEDALEWAKFTSETIDKIFSSKDEQVTASAIIPGSRNCAFIYDMPYSLTLQQFKTYEELFDQSFKTKGTKITTDKGKVLVEIPMPSQFHTPVDAKSMIIEIFS